MNQEKRLIVEKNTRKMITQFLKNGAIIELFVETIFKESPQRAAALTNAVMKQPDPHDSTKTVLQSLVETPEVAKYLDDIFFDDVSEKKL